MPGIRAIDRRTNSRVSYLPQQQQSRVLETVCVSNTTRQKQIRKMMIVSRWVQNRHYREQIILVVSADCRANKIRQILQTPAAIYNLVLLA